MHEKRFAPVTRTIAFLIFSIVMVIPFVVAFSTPGLHLLQLRFNPFSLITGFFLILNIVILLIMARKKIENEEGMWLLIYMVLVVLFSAAEIMQRLSATREAALFWANMGTLAGFIGPLLFLFALAYTNQSGRRYHFLSSILIVGTLVYLFFTNFTNIIFNNDTKLAVSQPWGWDYNNAVGPAVIVSIIWLVGLTSLAVARLASFRRHTTNPLLKRQSTLFIIGIILPIFAAILSALVFPALQIDIVPFATWTTAVSATFILYGIYRYQILTVNPAQFSGTILALMRESVVVTDKDYGIVYVNPTAEKLIDYKTGEKRTVSLLKSFTDDSVEKLQKVMAHDAASEAFELEHLDVVRSNANHVPVHVTGSRLKLANFQAWIMILTDITKELQTRSVIEHEVTVRTEELHQARAYLVSSINSLEQGFILVNAKGHTELINGVAAHLFGISGADANASRSLSEVVKTMSWDWDVNLPDVVDKVLTSKHHRQQEVSATNGSSYQLFVTPVLSGEQVLGATVIIQDVTEQRILDRSKDEFFSIASHELRTPLTAIRGNMSMVREYFPDAMKDDSLANMVTDTHDASVRLIAIVNDFLDSSKLEQGKMQFDLKPVALPPILEAVQKDLGVLLDKQHDKLTLEGIHKLPKVVSDEARVRQILYNLLSNAIKYCENGTITVSGEATDHNLTLRVTDTGKGISPEGQKLLFHKFQQAGDSTLTRDDTKGTGLGLYISRLLANNMHGDVMLEHSAVGKGSSFVLTLPVARKTPGN